LALPKIRVEQVSSRDRLEEFARLPFEIYGNRDAWWPPDIQNEIDLLSGRALITAYLDLSPFCVWRDAKLVARVSAVVNHRYNDHWHEKVGQLIHFEALPGEDDAVRALLDTASEWLQGRGMKAARSGFAAFLDYPYAIDNYGELPSFLLRGNPDCYHRYFKNAHFVTEKGQVDYTVALTQEVLARYQQIIGSLDSDAVSIKSWREYGFMAAIDAWTDVTNSAFARHWGWNPVTRQEVRPMLLPLERTPVAELSVIATIRDEPIGAVFSVHDLTGTLARIRHGVRLKPERGGGSRGALINIGVMEHARGKGIAQAMTARSFLTMAQHQMKYAGYTLVLDDNWASRRTAESLGARVSGNFLTYRRDF
jgi:ribosomal protein S18 acetylase RimI-like enzyme